MIRMSESETENTECGKYRAAPIRQTGTPGEAARIAGTFHAAPIRHELAGTISARVADLCPRCRDLLHPSTWQTPAGAPECVVHFNETQTAYLNTICQALHQLTGEEMYLTNKAAAITTLGQLFLMADPTAQVRTKWQTRPSRVERGDINDADWVEVIETDAAPSEPDNVSEPDNSARPVETGEVVEDEPPAVDGMYGESGDTLYREQE